MSIAPASVNAVIVVVSGITQDPSTYTISGTTLTFSGAPPTGTSNISVRHLGIAGIPNVPSAGSVVTSSIADANVTTAKIVDASITQAKLGTNVAGNGPAFSAYKSSSQSYSSSTWTKVTFTTEEYDTNNNYTSSTFTPTVAGYYQINARIQLIADGTAMNEINLQLYKNGSAARAGSYVYIPATTIAQWGAVISAVVYANGTTDYFEIYGKSDGSTLTFYGGGSTAYGFFQGTLIRTA
jgi:hypothetical protein